MPRRTGLWLLFAAVAAATAAIGLFPSAIPTLALGQRLTRQQALERADSFFVAHRMGPEGARRAVRFRGNDALRTYVELAGGGRDTLNALLGGQDVAIFTWTVRAFLPRDPHEARVDFAPDGRVVGFHRFLAETDARPEVSAEDGRRLAEQVATSWLGENLTRWHLVTSSFETRKASGRVDRTYTFERTDRKVADAPIRLDIVVAGDLPVQARPYVVVPESFQRRYGEMRSANDLIALIAQAGILLYLILAAGVLRHYALVGRVRWKPALVVGGLIGLLICAAGLNELPGSWFGYDTATSPLNFEILKVMEAVMGGVALALVVGLTLAAAESTTRPALPRHVDWWKAWRFRGTSEVAGRVAFGYVVAMISLAYVGLFYRITRGAGWWVPSELLDDPNLIATPMPWMSGIATALQAGVWEEALFRALPLSLLALWAKGRRGRGWWMAAGVVGTALVFGFAHANYPSWPPYSRGVEIFLDACFWAVLYLWLGLIVTVVAHFSYDLFLFGLFATSGDGLQYHITAAILLVALLAPALAVAWRWLRQRRLEALPEAGRFAAWSPTPPTREPADSHTPAAPGSLQPGARTAALAVAGVALLMVTLIPSSPRLGDPFTAGRAQVLSTADSVIRARGVDPAGWRRLATTAQDSSAAWTRYLAQLGAADFLGSLASTYRPPAWWTVRYVHRGSTAAERAEEWRVRIWPDGRPLDVHHLVPDSARGDTLNAAQARRVAITAVADAGIDTLALRPSDVEATERPARRDYEVTWADTTIHIPGDAEARVRVTLAGDQPILVRRSVELPESFLRSERERGTTRLVVTLLGASILLLLVVAGIIVVMRKRAAILADTLLNRKRTLAIIAGLSLFGLGSTLNRFPSELFTWDTSMPWATWLTIHLVSAVMAVVPALAAWALWLLLSALRRRVGIHLLPGGADARRDLLLAAIGLGALPTMLTMFLALASRTGMSVPPTTGLNQAVAWLGQALAMPSEVVFTVMAIAIPSLVVAGVARRRVGRTLWVAALFAPVVALAVVVTPTGANPLLRVSVLVVTVAVEGWIALRFWAPLSVWSWMVAGLVDASFSALRTAVHAPTPVEKLGGVATLLLALALVVLALRVRLVPSATGSATAHAGTG